MSQTVNVHEAKTHFSKLLQRVMTGESIVIAKNGQPVAVLAPLEKPRARREPGPDHGLVLIGPDFDDPLPEFEEYM